MKRLKKAGSFTDDAENCMPVQVPEKETSSGKLGGKRSENNSTLHEPSARQKSANRSAILARRRIVEVIQAFLPGFRIPLIQSGLF